MSIRIAEESDALAISSLVKSLAHFYLDDPKAELPVWLTDTKLRAYMDNPDQSIIN